MVLVCLGDDNVEYDPGISHLAEQLRKSAEEMIDLLGMQLPIVSKLKVNNSYCIVAIQ